VTPDTGMAGADPMAGLRGYHLPDVPSWWPPAPGWWALAVLLVVAVAITAWWILRRHRCRAAARQAARELAELRSHLAAGGDAAAFLRDLSKLLRRYAIAAFPRREVAALTGEQWLCFLDRHSDGERFRSGPGRQLLEAPYQAGSEGLTEELAALVEDWIRHNRESCP
jgi:hypothetical protein